MEEINRIVGSPQTGFIIGIVGLFLAIVGIALTIRSTRRKKPRFAMYSHNIVSGKIGATSAIQISYLGYGHPIDSFTITKLLIWNDGSETIHRQDIAKAEPLTINAKPPAIILEAKLIRARDETCQFQHSVSRDRSQITLSFDYLDKGDGAYLQIFHTGTSNTDLELRGKVKGVGKFVEIKQTYHFPLDAKLKYFFQSTLFFMIAILVVALPYSKDRDREPSTWATVLVVVIALSNYCTVLYRLFSEGVPRHFKEFRESLLD